MSTRVATWPRGTRVVWRGLTWEQFREVRAHQGPPAEKALDVYTRCLVEGPRPDEIAAGIMMWIYQYESDNSPFKGTFESLAVPLQQYRERVRGSYLLSAQALIASVFKIPFEVMNAWDSETFLCRIAQAELIAGVPLNPVDPESIEQGPTSGKGKRPKKLLNPAQQKVVDKKYGAGTSEKYNANTVRNEGQAPSKQKDVDSETFSYTK